jgi:hypothetical protein
MKRATKVKLEVIKPAAHLHFSDSVGQRGISIYTQKLSEALNTGGVVQIMAGDAYMKHQLKKSAEMLNLKLVYALDGECLYVKPLAVDGDLKRLMLLLREPRSENELMSKKLELHLKNTLAKLAADGLAHFHKEKWVLTEKGLDAL